MSGRAQDLKPVLISDMGIGLGIHIKDYRSRRRVPIPLCRVDHWQDIDWAVDTSGGLGGKPCGRCEGVWNKLRAEAVKKQKVKEKAKNKRARSTPKGQEQNRQRVAAYRQANRRIYNKKKTIRYWQNHDRETARKREYYQANQERMRARHKAWLAKNRDRVNARRRERARRLREEQGN